MTRVSTAELSDRLPDLLARVLEHGERFVIERDGEPIATLGPPDAANGTGPSDATDLRAHDPPPAVAAHDPAVAALLADIEAIRRDAAAAPTGAARSLREIAEQLADLEWPDDEFADDLEAIQAAQGLIGEPPTWRD